MPKTSKIESLTDNPTLNLALDTIRINKQALVFVNTKPSAEKQAEVIAAKIKTKDAKLELLSEKLLHVLSSPTKQCERLSRCIKKGIAFHHAGLTIKQKELIEDNFRKGTIKIICCTPTLAFGLDLPAFRAIIKDLKRYTQHGLAWIPVLEYLQQAGRAGRPKYDKFGEAIAISSSLPEKDKIYEDYVKGEPEKIYSKLAVEPVLRTYLLSLIATRFVKNKKEIMDFFSKTFYAHQYEDTEKLEAVIAKMLRLLEEWEFIKSSEKDFNTADEIANDVYTATLLGKRVAELYLDPLTANFLINCLRGASSMRLKPVSFLQMISHTLEIRPLLRTRVKEYDKLQEYLTENHEFILEDEPSMYDPEYDDFINSIKTAIFFENWVDENSEDFLLEEFNIRPGEIRAKLSIADWLLYASEELTKILQFRTLIPEVRKMRLRLKYGVKEELLPLLRLKGVGRVRARRLFNNRIKDLGDIKKADIATLSQLLGKSTALKVKKQVGQEIKEIKENKRKGQISIKDY